MQRMLDSFENDVARRDKKFNAEDAQSGMDILMRHYETELEKPLRSAITGTLPRSLLIQVSSHKTSNCTFCCSDQCVQAHTRQCIIQHSMLHSRCDSL